MNDHRWVAQGGQSSRGGQGTGRRVQNADGLVGFEKRLIKPWNRQARGRFRREVTSYETLDHPQLPRLLDHNSEQWQDKRVELFLVLDFVDGETLGEFVSNNGPLSLEDALVFMEQILAAIAHCHANDVVHRDIKPLNLILLSGAPADPIIVDFGLSFNEQNPDAPDLTRVNEEVGNRFLRLPEHSTGGRNPASDIVQVLGLFFYVLTGIEPRVLLDDQGFAPHQRPEAKAILDATLPEPSRRRILATFDRGFRTITTQRFATAEQLMEGIRTISEPEDDGSQLEELLAQLDEAVAAVDHQEMQRRQDVLSAFLHSANNQVQMLANSKSLYVTQGGGPDDVTAERPFKMINLALVPQGVIAKKMVLFRFTLVGTSEVELTVGDVSLWRGIDPDDTGLRDVILRLVTKQYLDTYH